MKLKYYLRGLGIGIIVTAIIMMITNAGSGKPLTDEQIMERAEELGMTRPQEDSEESEEGDSEKKGAPSSIGVFSPEENQTSGDAKKPEETQLPENQEEAKTEGEDSADPDTSKEEGNAGDAGSSGAKEASGGDAKNPDDGGASDENGATAGDGLEGAGDSGTAKEPEMITIEISQGEYSDSISRKLVEAGLISDAVDFNSYLVENGMDNLLAVGVHQIPKGANYEEIAGALCRR